MSENLNTKPQKEENAGCLGIGISFMIPLVGFILYFAKKDSVENANAYLYGALAGMGVSLLMTAISSAM